MDIEGMSTCLFHPDSAFLEAGILRSMPKIIILDNVALPVEACHVKQGSLRVLFALLFSEWGSSSLRSLLLEIV